MTSLCESVNHKLMMSNLKTKLSAVIITLNEESNIERVIHSLSWADEIVVFDSGSQDQTCEIAKKLGAIIHQGPWSGFGLQKRKAAELATHDWILSVDADETVSRKLAAEIQSRFSELNPQTGYCIPRKSFYLNHWIFHGGWYPDYQLRLFNRKHSQWNENTIHEKVISSNIEYLNSPMEHYVFKNKAHQVQTNNKYSTLQAEEYVSKGGEFSFFKLMIKPFVKFMECYFLKLGFLDGFPGFIIAVSAGYSVFIRWVKIWELQQTIKTKAKV